MARLGKRALASKPLRLDARMARDVERLSGDTGYSQNEIFLMAIRSYLYDNRQYFLDDMIEELCLSKIERSVKLMHDEAHISCGGMTVDMVRRDETGLDAGIETIGRRAEIYVCTMKFYNKRDEAIIADEQEVNVNSDEWNKYKRYLYNTFVNYADLDNDLLKEYFRYKFAYE